MSYHVTVHTVYGSGWDQCTLNTGQDGISNYIINYWRLEKSVNNCCVVDSNKQLSTWCNIMVSIKERNNLFRLCFLYISLTKLLSSLTYRHNWRFFLWTPFIVSTHTSISPLLQAHCLCKWLCSLLTNVIITPQLTTQV